MEPDDKPAFLIAQRKQRRIIVAAIVGTLLLVAAVVYHRPILRLLEPAPEPYSETMRADFDLWMGEVLPHFVVETSTRDLERFEAAAADLIDKGAFHATVRRRAELLVDDIRDFRAYAKARGIIASKDQLREHVDNLTEELFGLQEALWQMGAPYSIDFQVRAGQQGAAWTLDVIITTSRVHGISTLAAGEQQLRVLRVERLDTLNLLDLTHGTAGRGMARVRVPTLRGLANNVFLPVLHRRPQLRGMFEHSRKMDLLAIQFRPVLLDLFADVPEDEILEIGQLAHDRREVLEELDAVLDEYGRGLIAPTDFFLSQGWFERMRDGLGEEDHGPLLARLQRFTESTDLPIEKRDAIQRASDLIFERVARIAELHEAWHLLAPEPQNAPGVGLTRGVAAEVVAYLGMMADAESLVDLALVTEQIGRQFRQHKASEDPRETTSSAAIRLVFLNLAGIALEDTDTDLPRGEGIFGGMTQQYRAKLPRIRSMAKRELRALFGEERSLKHLGFRTGVMGLGAP